MGAIVSDDYRKEQEVLEQDPIVQAMAAEALTALEHLPATRSHEDGTPTHEWMGICNAEYARRGGKNAHSLGGAARAINTVMERS